MGGFITSQRGSSQGGAKEARGGGGGGAIAGPFHQLHRGSSHEAVLWWKQRCSSSELLTPASALIQPLRSTSAHERLWELRTGSAGSLHKRKHLPSCCLHQGSGRRVRTDARPLPRSASSFSVGQQCGDSLLYVGVTFTFPFI